MLRFTLANKNAASRGASSAANAARTMAGGNNRADIQKEQWVEAAVDVPTGEAEFSEPLTVGELEDSRQMLEQSMCASVSSSASDDVDADGQMEQIHGHASRLAQREQMTNALNTALVMASNVEVQRACLSAMQSDPKVFAAMEQMARSYGMSLQLDSAQSNGRLALPAPPPAAVEDAPGGDGRGPLQPLRALLDSIADAVGDVGDVIVNYVQRMSRRLNNLMLRLQGGPEAEIQGVDDQVDASGKKVPAGNPLVDVAVAAASLVVVIAFVGRIGRVPFRR